MPYTKGQIIGAAFGELSLSDASGFDISPEEKANALGRLDGMVGTWAKKGIRLGYNFPGDINAQAGIPDDAYEVVMTNLARRLAPGLGKALNPETVKIAREGYDALLWDAAQPPQQQLPHTQPNGAGNKPWRVANRTFQPRPDNSPLRYDSRGGDLDILQE